jgi:hypothetical protein
MPRKHNHQVRAAHRHFLATDAEMYVSITRAATLAKRSRQTIHNWINAGTIRTEHVAGRRVVLKSSLPSPETPR